MIERPTIYTRDSIEMTERERAIARAEWDTLTQEWRDSLYESFTPAMAEDFEAAALAAGVCTRKGAGLVSVSTTDTRSKFGASKPLSPVHRARAQRRADDASGVYMPPTDGDSMRVRHLRRAVGFTARAQAVSEKGRRCDEVLMLTLTYANGGDWRPNHMGALTKRMREWFRRQGVAFRYVWVAELQKRGVIHYHMALWVPFGFRIPMADRRGWWPHGSTNTEKARNAVPYLMKYLSKGSDKAGCWRLPDGARMHGNGGLEHAFKRARRWLGLPAFVRARSSANCDWKRIEGGGWASPDGEWFPAEYQRARCGPFLAFERINDHGRPFEADGPFSWVPGFAGVVHQ